MASEKGNKSKNNGDDLSTILSHEEQVELTLLIANITEVMRKQITDTFDAASTTKADRESKNSLQDTENNPNVDNAGKAEESVEEKDARELREKRARDLSAPKMQDLKKAVEEHFDKWRESIILRLGEVVNSPKKLEEQIEHASIKATPDSEKETQTKVISRWPFGQVLSCIPAPPEIISHMSCALSSFYRIVYTLL
jgi:ERCC4-related helicase